PTSGDYNWFCSGLDVWLRIWQLSQRQPIRRELYLGNERLDAESSPLHSSLHSARVNKCRCETGVARRRDRGDNAGPWGRELCAAHDLGSERLGEWAPVNRGK